MGMFPAKFDQFELVFEIQVSRSKGQIVHGGQSGDAHIRFDPFADARIGKAHQQQGEILGKVRQRFEDFVDIAALFQDIEQVQDFSVVTIQDFQWSGDFFFWCGRFGSGSEAVREITPHFGGAAR